jgi:uncharacterized protein (DUF885 family)
VNKIVWPFLIVSLFIMHSCNSNTSQDNKFEALAENYVEKMLTMYPEWATYLGDHRFDNLLNDYSMHGITHASQTQRFYLDSLGNITTDQLSAANKIDYQIMKSNIKEAIFKLDTLREYEWNPLYYNVGSSINGLLARDFAALEERLLSVAGRLQDLVQVLEHAKTNLSAPPQIFTETAIIQNKGVTRLVQEELTQFLDSIPKLKQELTPVQTQAIAALENYGIWLEQDLLPRSTGDFRIGEEKFSKKLTYILESEFTQDEILNRAQNDLNTTQDEMYKTALPLFNKYYPDESDSKNKQDKKYIIKKVLNSLAAIHPTNETIVDLAQKALKSCTNFVAKNNLVSIPDEPIKVIVMPEFARGVAVAYCDAPGPLEAKGETFYAISPTPKDWSSDRVESFFKEYNNYMLQNLTVHEAMPGHYLQLAHANKFKTQTQIRMIFESGTFIEGWATYAEQLMVEKGYRGPELKMQQLKMRLRLLINAIIDQEIHIAGMSEKKAMDLMMNQGFQEEGEAAGKWRRACLSSTQLSTYYVGNLEVNELRKSFERKMGANFDMKEFHNLLLSYGSIAPKYVRQLLGV